MVPSRPVTLCLFNSADSELAQRRKASSNPLVRPPPYVTGRPSTQRGLRSSLHHGAHRYFGRIRVYPGEPQCAGRCPGQWDRMLAMDSVLASRSSADYFRRRASLDRTILWVGVKALPPIHAVPFCASRVRRPLASGAAVTGRQRFDSEPSEFQKALLQRLRLGPLRPMRVGVQVWHRECPSCSYLLV